MQHVQNIAIIALLNLVVYYRTLFFGYVGDDVERSERKEPIFKNTFHRWWIQFIGLRHIDSMVSHLMNIVVHTICCEMIYITFGANYLSLITALLFSVNPVNIQGSIWISGRNYATSSIFCLAMFLFPPLSWAFYMASSFFAVNAWFAPLAFLGTKYWYMAGIIPLVWLLNQANKETLNRKLYQTGGLKTTNREMRAISFRKIVPFIKTYIYYFVLCIIPFEIGIEHAFLRGFGTNKTDNIKGYKKNWVFWLGLTVFLSVCFWSAWCILNGWNTVAWGLFWFTINIAMWSNFVTYQQQIALRFCYLANIGLMYALATLILPYPALILAFLVGYAVRLHYVSQMYLNDWWAVEYTIQEIKDGHYMWLMRGVKKFFEKDFMGSYKDFMEAYRHKPYDLKVLFNLSVISLILGDPDKSREFFEKAKVNIYDELEDDIKPAFEALDVMIKKLEESKARGETQIQLDLSKLMVVK